MFFQSKDWSKRNLEKCTVCGQKIYIKNYSAKSPLYQAMCQNQICYECAYWQNIINHPFKYMQIVNQTLYEFLPWKEPCLGQILGQKMFILHKSGKPMKSNDVWEKGRIPYRFQKYLPDTAYLIEKKTYTKLTKGRVGCVARGCYDRYHCYRYNYRIEFETGPYNQVPKDWVVGNEKCPAFINLREIKNFDYIDINDILTNNLNINEND